MDKARRALLEVGAILDERELPFCLILGTCLGFVRDGGFIGYDTDIDLGMKVEDLRPAAGELSAAFAKAGFEARVHTQPVRYPRAIVLRRDGIKLDLAGFILNGDERYSPSTRKDYAVVYPARFFEIWGSVECLGRTWRTPYPVRDYLAYHYGPTWEVTDPRWNPGLGPARRSQYREKVR